MRVNRIVTSCRMQLKEQSRNMFSLALLFSMPLAVFLLLYATAPSYLKPLLLLESGGAKEVLLPVRVSMSLPMAMIGVTWFVGLAAMNSLLRSYSLDRRLILCGYGFGELVLARILFLIPIIALSSFVIVGFASIFILPNNIFFAFAAVFLAGLIAMGAGLLIGSLVKRDLEGSFLVVGIFGVEMAALTNSTEQFFPAYFPKQLLLVAFFGQSPDLLPILGISVSLAVFFITLAWIFYAQKLNVKI